MTVSFTCSDATSGIATCPPAQTVSTEGQGQLITGTATDNVSNTASASVSVNLDKTPPSLTVTMPGGTVSNSPLTVSGSASDFLSGLDTVTCDGLLAPLSGTILTCEVSLIQGVNSIVITATDRAGNSASQTLTVTLGGQLSPPPNSVEITPGRLALVVDEPRELALVDDFGRPAEGASWIVSDPSVVEIASTSPLILTGKAPGSATVSATWQGFVADAQVTVFAGPTLPPGTVRWSAQPAPAFSTVQVLQAQPTENAPDIYSVEKEGTGNLIIRALASDGRQIWRRPVELSGGMALSAVTAQYTARFFVQALADAFGGLLIVTEDDFGVSTEIIRLDGATGQETWRFASTGRLFGDLAVHPDGTIFVGEIPNLANPDIQVLAIDGTAGFVKSRVAVPRSFQAFETNCAFQNNTVLPTASGLGAPMVAPNGSMYVETAVSTLTSQNFDPACTLLESHVIRDTSLMLLELRPDGSSQWRTLRQDHSEGPFTKEPPAVDYFLGEVIPDGQGGLLAAWTYRLTQFGTNGSPVATLTLEVRMDHVTDSGQNEYTLFPNPSLILENSSLILGENGTAFARSGHGKIVSFDTASGAVHWSWEPGSAFSIMVAAAAGNGLVAAVFFPDGTRHIARLDSTGQATFDAWTWPGFPIQYAFGDMWLAQGSVDALSAPAILWPFSVWAKSNGEPTRASKGTIRLQAHKVTGTAWINGTAAADQIAEAVGFWQINAGILIDPVPPFDTVSNCDPVKFPSGECLGSDDITAIPSNKDQFNPTWLEVYRRFCGSPAITQDAQRSFCLASGSQLLLTADVGSRGIDFGATPNLGNPQTPINLSAIADTAEGLVIAHELGHQFQLPGCTFSLLGPPSVLNCGTDNLMHEGFKPFSTFPGDKLNHAQIQRARKGAAKWSR